MKVKPRGIEIPLIIVMIILGIGVLSALGILIYRLGQNGVFEQNSAAETSIAKTTTVYEAPETTQAKTTAEIEDETTAAQTEESAKKSETETNVTSETEKKDDAGEEDTTEPEAEQEEAKTEKPDTTKKSEPKKSDTAKTEAKNGKTTTTTAVAEDKSDETLFKEYVLDVLIPQYGLAALSQEMQAEECKGVVSAMIRDFNNSKENEMLIVRLEPYNPYYASYPVLELYGIKDKQVVKLSEVKCQYPMSEWSMRTEGSVVYLSGVQEDVGGSEEENRSYEIDVDATRHFLLNVSETINQGMPEGFERHYSDRAPWVCEITNRIADSSRGNEGRVYTISDSTNVREDFLYKE